MTDETILQEYLNQEISQPEQRTKEWYEIRKTTVGGSEIATILGINPFSSVEKLIRGKIGLDKFDGNIATRWGNLFESVTEKWTELVLKMKDSIKEAGSIEGALPGQRYSPDGLGIVEFLDEDSILQKYIILFEFKSPYSSLPNNRVPNHYNTQVLTGLLSIPIAENAIFVNNCYRKCVLPELNFTSTYDKLFHHRDWNKLKYGLERNTPYGVGVICFHQTKKARRAVREYMDSIYDSDVDDVDVDADTNQYEDVDFDILLSDEIIDFGISCEKVMDRLLYLHDNKFIQSESLRILHNYNRVNELDIVVMHDLHHDDHDLDITEFYNNEINKVKQKCLKNKLKFIGVLPWKLMRTDLIHVERDQEFLEKIREPVADVVNKLRLLDASDNPISEYYKMYPSEIPDMEDNEHDDMIKIQFKTVDLVIE